MDWAIKERSGFESIEHYLDDFLFAGRADSSECTNLMSNFSSLCQELGIPLAVENTIGPSCVITFLGLEIDTLERVIKILPPKLPEVQQKLIETLNKKKITLKDLQSLTGLLNVCARTHARAIPAVKAFNRRFFEAMQGVCKPNHFIRFSVGMKDDIRMWLSYLEKFNRSCTFGLNEWLSNMQLDLYTDSAGSPYHGCGVYFSTHWKFFQWPASWNRSEIMTHITFLELDPIVLSIVLLRHQFCNKQIIFHTDNLALVPILSKKSSKSERVMELIRPLVLHTMLCNMQFKAVHSISKVVLTPLRMPVLENSG